MKSTADDSRPRDVDFALETLDAVAFEIDLETGQLSATGAFDRLFGHPPSDVPDRDAFVDRTVHPADRSTVRRALRSATSHAPSDTVVFDYRTDPAAGTIRRVRTELSVRRDPAGEPSHLVGVTTDVTDETRLEQQLVSLHEASRDLITAERPVDVARSTVDASETILGFANTTVRLVDADGTRLEKVAATDGAEVKAGDLADYHVDGDSPAARVYREAEPETVDALATVDDDYDRGELRAAMYVPLGDHGVMSIGHTDSDGFDDMDRELANTLGKLASAALTRIESEAELRASNDRLERLISFVSHDLRNPLNVAEGRLELAEAECASDHLQSVDTALQRMDVLIDDLLALAREGTAAVDLEPLALRSVAERSWAHVATGDATMEVASSRLIRADAGRLTQLFENLFRNSVEHGSTGNRTATPSSDSVEPGSTDARSQVRENSVEHGDDVTVTVGVLDDGFFVADDGAGIPPERRGDVFDVGYSSAGTGTGFGLAIVHEIAETHGWDVTLSESADGGARFEFTGVDLP
jgi:PAS domain S-box-containing protein